MNSNNYQEVYDRFKLKIDRTEALSKSEKLLVKSTLMLCLWDQSSSDVIAAQHARDQMGDQKLKLMQSGEFTDLVDEALGRDAGK